MRRWVLEETKLGAMWRQLEEQPQSLELEGRSSGGYSEKSILIIFPLVVGAIYTAAVVSIYMLT